MGKILKSVFSIMSPRGNCLKAVVRQYKILQELGFPVALVVKNRCGFIPWVGKSPWRSRGSTLQYSCLGNLMDVCLVGYSPYGCKVSNTTGTYTVHTQGNFIILSEFSLAHCSPGPFS